MSVQLVLYPQNYKGRYSSTSTPVFNEYVADNVNFNSLLNLTGYDSTVSDVGLDAINNSVGIAAWKRFRSTGGSWASVTMPSRSIVNKLELYSASGSTSSSGVYQKIIGLTMGTVYDLSINITQAGAGGLLVIGTQGNITSAYKTLGGQTLFTELSSAKTGTQTVSFTAGSSEEIFLLAYQNDNGSTVYVDNISIQESAQVPTLIYTDLFDGQVICDLYEDEDIPLTLSVDNFKNVAEKVQSYSKDFNLPATKRNNKIFTHLFEVSKVWDSFSFNPYRKTKCILKQDGYDIFKGYLRLIDVVNKEGEISYNVNLYSDAITLMEILKSKNLSNLNNISELDHLYNKTNIKGSWDSTGILLTTPLGVNSFAGAYNDTHTQVLKYPFVDWTGNIEIANPSSSGTSGYPELNSLDNAFRPFINCKYLVDNIFNDAGFTYTSVFFNTTTFNKLFMDFNWGEGNAPADFDSTAQGRYLWDGVTTIYATASYTQLNINQNTQNWGSEFGWSNYQMTATNNGTTYSIDYWYAFNWTAGSVFECRWVHKNSSGIIYPLGVIDYIYVSYPSSSGSGTPFAGNFNRTLAAGDTLEAQFRKTSGTVAQYPYVGTTAIIDVQVTNNSTTAGSLVNTSRGELGQWNFFKGLIKMFNLVILNDKDNEDNLLIEPYDSFFNINTSGTSLPSRSIKYDWTEKIDASEIKLTPLQLLKETIFKYEPDDDDYAFNLYKKATNGILYGQKIWDSNTQFNFTLSEGKEEISASPFSATLIKPLFGAFSDFIVPSIFSSNDDNTENESFDNAPRILYNNGKKDTNITYYIPAQAGLSSENQDEFLQFSHLSEIQTSTNTVDYNFGECQLINPIGNSPSNNLFNTYWANYYFELYNINTRVMVLKVNLNSTDINTFNFDDKIMIKNKEFRVNKIDYKPNDLSTVEFILIG